LGEVTLIFPSLLPKQVTLVELRVAANGPLGWIMIVPTDPSKSIKQDVFTASRIITSEVVLGRPMYAPEDCHVVPPSMLYSLVPYPPIGFETVIVPSLTPLQEMAVVATPAVSGLGCVTA